MVRVHFLVGPFVGVSLFGDACAARPSPADASAPTDAPTQTGPIRAPGASEPRNCDGSVAKFQWCACHDGHYECSEGQRPICSDARVAIVTSCPDDRTVVDGESCQREPSVCAGPPR
jgi:hypothetical protein